MKLPPSKVAQYITDQIKVSGRLQKDIASECDFPKPNMISMIKSGNSPLPLSKVGQMAKSLDVDPIQLLKLYFEDYYPGTWAEISPLMETAINPTELCILNALRAAAGGAIPHKLNESSQQLFEDFLKSIQTTTECN